MSQNLYVGNLSYQTTADDLRTAFAPHGVVLSSQIVIDRETGKPRGFAFVEMSSGGPDAIKALNLSELHGRTITVNEARTKDSGRRPRRF